MLPTDRAEFLNIAGVMYASLVAVTFGLAWLAGLRPVDDVHWSLTDCGWSLLAVLPMLAAFFLARNVRRVVIDLLGPTLVQCTWYDLLLLSLLAGLGEELLFRGVLQPWLARWHPLVGLWGANLLFGLLHALTLGYAALATAFGVYLSWLADGPLGRNLLRPILAHAVYDFLALLLILRSYRRHTAEGHATKEDL